MKRGFLLSSVVLLFVVSFTFADTFGTGANQFTIGFVSISGSTNPTSGYGIVANDYRIGKYEITNDQWNKFQNAYGAVTRAPTTAYDYSPYFTGTNVPTNCVSWCEAAQFVNWLNTSTGHQAAYKFTGTQGTSDYTLGVWSASDAGYNAANPYRNSNAFYFLPTENEWVKAAYWNGLTLQAWATVGNVSPTLGDAVMGTGWNLYINAYATNPYGPWAVGSGSKELNGTYDMMGNVSEWMESPYNAGEYLSDSGRVLRGGSFGKGDFEAGYPASFVRYSISPFYEGYGVGFRIASVVPEPASVTLMVLGAAWFAAKRKR